MRIISTIWSIADMSFCWHTRDEYVTKLWIKKEGVRYIFMQDIFRLPDMKLCIRAQVDSVCLVNGTLAESPELNEKFAPFMQ